MNRLREIAEQERMRAIYEIRLYRALNSLLKRYAAPLTKNYEVAKEQGIEVAFEGLEDKIRELLMSYYHNIGVMFGARTIEAFENSYKSLQLKSTRTIFDQQLDIWLKHNAAKKARLIAQSMRTSAARILRQAVNQGIGEVATAKALGKKFKDLAPYQAARIARTEIHAASNAASLMAANATPVRPKKEWLVVEDERTRESHNLANGQVVDIDDPFSVGGAALMFPGDPDGPPEEVINCRCVIGWSF